MTDTHIDKQNGEIKKPRKKRVLKPGDKAAKEIKYYQETQRETFIPVAAMQRAVREILSKHEKNRITPLAFKMIHIALEDYLTKIFVGTQIEAIHAKRITIQKGDMDTVFRVHKVMCGGHDIETEPVNPRMSEAHKKQYAKAKRTRKRSKKVIPPVTTTTSVEDIQSVTTRIEEEVVFEEEMVVEKERMRGMEDIEQADDDWLLEEDDT